VGRDEYDRAVARIQELIAAGDTYQVNYSFPLSTPFSGDAYELYRNLCLAQGAPYSAYLDLGRFKVLCLSPELFFERRGNHVITKPMKGTVKRGRWLAEDLKLAQWLRESAKDRAENVMIVDLLRNDLGKVAVPGSVSVSSLFDVERFETVWQMTSTVEATLKEGTTLVDLMTALFPCGSVTGAPKIRTMQIIRELERFPRGAYTGAIGFLKPGGDCIFNVAIRTVVVDTETNTATFGVGGGVTIDSTADREYEECLVKSRFLHVNFVPFSG
jgi:para-aminobenzoate synthetase/4-amino-4-deoxychorismate lyase